MLDILRNHLTEKQLLAIVTRITNQYRDFLSYERNHTYKKLFSNDYAAHRKKNTLSWAIFSAFPDKSVLEGQLVVSLTNDSSGHKRPLLSNENIAIHINSDTANYNACYLSKFYELNGDGCTSKKIYAYIKFQEKKNKLLNLTICVPDEKGNIIAEEVLLNQEQLLKLAA